jgi:Putative Actinobacterial Holin-X, holin superfamily III
MEKILPMPLQGRRNDQTHESLRDTFRKLSQKGRSWIAAEAELAQAEIASDVRRIAIIVALAVSVLGAAFVAMMLFMLFLVSLIAPYVGGLANAAGVLALVLVILAAGAGWWAWNLAHAQLGVVSILKRWADIAGNGGEHKI